MEDTKISIVVPAYNMEHYIVNTVHSICAQTYRNIEIILVDDGSKDETLRVFGQLEKEDPRIRVIHKENGGVTSARLCGVKAATGEWIGFVDGDDFVGSGMYEMLICNAQKYDAQISHCGYQMVFPSRIDYYYGTGQLVEQDTKTGLRNLLEGVFVDPGLCNKLFHSSLFERLLYDGIMDDSIKNNEDLLMNFYLFRESKRSVFVDECPYHYMVREGSAATSILNEHKLKDPLKVLRILEKETIYDGELLLLVRRRIVSQLIGLSALQCNGQKDLVYLPRKNARRELRRMLPEILQKNYSRKQKLMALWASVWPASYGWVHSVYEKLTGLDKKYEVD